LGIEGEEKQAKDIGKIINKIIAENFPNLKTDMSIQVQEVSRTPNRHDQNKNSPQHITVKTISKESKERILKAIKREKLNNKK
jgi:hypothetical protein